jgi:hypothetical protein
VTDTDPAAVPYRVVDRENYGWYQASALGGGTYWTTGHTNGLPDVTFSTYPGLVAARGPVRPVLPVTDADMEALHTLLGQAGRKGITSLTAALEVVFNRLNTEHHRSGPDLDGFQYAKRTMMAGRAGSWEASLLMEVTWFGNGLNLAKPTKVLKEGDIAWPPRSRPCPPRRQDRPRRDSRDHLAGGSPTPAGTPNSRRHSPGLSPPTPTPWSGTR